MKIPDSGAWRNLIHPCMYLLVRLLSPPVCRVTILFHVQNGVFTDRYTFSVSKEDCQAVYRLGPYFSVPPIGSLDNVLVTQRIL